MTQPDAHDPNARRRQWGALLDATMRQRGMRNIDLARALDGAYDRSMISQWRAGKALPGELGAWRVATAMELPPLQFLRDATYGEMADRVEEEIKQAVRAALADAVDRGMLPAPRDSTLDLLHSVGDPDWSRQVAAEYERELAAARHRVTLEIALHERTQDPDRHTAGAQPEEEESAGPGRSATPRPRRESLEHIIEMVELGERLVAERERGQNGDRDAS